MLEKIYVYQDYNTDKLYFVQAKTLTIAYQKIENKLGFRYTEAYLKCIAEIKPEELTQIIL